MTELSLEERVENLEKAVMLLIRFLISSQKTDEKEIMEKLYS